MAANLLTHSVREHASNKQAMIGPLSGALFTTNVLGCTVCGCKSMMKQRWAEWRSLEWRGSRRHAYDIDMFSLLQVDIFDVGVLSGGCMTVTPSSGRVFEGKSLKDAITHGPVRSGQEAKALGMGA
jgi:hypothetical protein